MEPEREIDAPEADAMMRRLAAHIDGQLPAGYGFTLLVHNFSGPEMFYISNAKRRSMIKAMQEFVRRQKARGY